MVAPATAAAIVRAHRPVAIGLVVLWGVPLARWILVGNAARGRDDDV
jgi:hypothetical protein